MNSVREPLAVLAIPSIRPIGFLLQRNPYKSLLAALTFLSLCVGAFAQIAPYSADYYLVNPEEYLNKNISIYVYGASYHPSDSFSKDGYKAIYVNTKSGQISVLVREGQLKSFLARYSGGYFESKGMISGKLIKMEGEKYSRFNNPYCIELN